MDQAGKSPLTTFMPAYPQGYYTLQLEERAQRTIAIMLCQADQDNAEDLMRGIMVNGRPAGGFVKRLKWPDRQVLGLESQEHAPRGYATPGFSPC